MRRCNMCGSQLQDSYKACPNCGNTNLMSEQTSNPSYQSQYQQPMNGQQYGQYQQPMNVKQKGNFGWALLGFFIPLVGLILYLVWKDEKPGDAKMAGKGALVSVIVSVIITIISMIIFVYMVSLLGF